MLAYGSDIWQAAIIMWQGRLGQNYIRTSFKCQKLEEENVVLSNI